MATQKCPKCKSNRVRLGYRSTPPLMKLLFRYNLLCDQCNWEFNGFAIPGTVGGKIKKKRGSKTPVLRNSDAYLAPANATEKKPCIDDDCDSIASRGEFDETVALGTSEVVHLPKHIALVRKKRVRIKLHGS